MDMTLSRREFMKRSLLAVGASAVYARPLWSAPSPGAAGTIIGAADRHRFSIGQMRCIAINDGMFSYKAQRFFVNAPPTELEAELQARATNPDAIPSPFTCLAVDTGKHRVVIDAGGGPSIPKVGHLRANLLAEGFAPETVDTVIITHAHPDHIGGLIDEGGSPVFPNAQHVIWHTEWSFWSAEENLQKQPAGHASFVRKYLLPLRDQLTMVSREGEILPGIHALAAPGHTPGHMVVMLASGNDQLLFISDTVLHQIHLARPEWYTDYDLDREGAAVAKRRIFNRAAADRALVLAFHFHPFPSLGHVAPRGNGWAWEPI